MGAGLGNTTALITDGRFSGASRGFIHWCVYADFGVCAYAHSVFTCARLQGTSVPEARVGGPIGLVRDGDKIVIDSESRTINLGRRWGGAGTAQEGVGGVGQGQADGEKGNLVQVCPGCRGKCF